MTTKPPVFLLSFIIVILANDLFSKLKVSEYLIITMTTIVVTGKGPLICESSSNLKRHMNLAHSSSPLKLVKCNLYQQTFDNHLTLNKHVLSEHSTHKPVKCSDCVKTFKHKSCINYHIKIRHLGISFSCEICNK